MITSLSIIFPVFNEELRLKSGLSHIKNFLKKKKNFKTEIIFVDDGSKDSSYNLIIEFIKKIKKNSKTNLKVIRSQNNLGKGHALKLGVKEAKYNWILTVDIDMSVSLYQFLYWIEKKLVKKKYLVYFGSRTHKKSIVKRQFIRDVLGNIMRLLITKILDIKIKDTQCGYKLYKKRIAKLIFSKMKSYGFDHDLELVLILKSKNIKIKELPVKWIHKGNSQLNVFWDPIKMFLEMFEIKSRYL
tara:strand:- start:66 stop:794 length:729 start_codon:yes stop_codon:yes gene_type:complete